MERAPHRESETGVAKSKVVTLLLRMVVLSFEWTLAETTFGGDILKLDILFPFWAIRPFQFHLETEQKT